MDPVDDPARPDLAARVERALLGRPASMGRREVSEGAGVEPVTARRFWHAMGFQNVEDDEAMFTEADLEALRRVARLIGEDRVSEELALGMTRAFARTSDRLAVWQTQLVAESLTVPVLRGARGQATAGRCPSRGIAADAAELLASICDDIEPLLVYVWRRHLTNAIARMLADADPAVHSDPSAPIRVVGFADLVSFTSFVRRMSERQLARLVQRFELLASDVITEHGGRVIKTVGDEVLFVHTDAAAASAIALDLVDAMAEDELLPPVRVGLAHGRVVSRLGDVFGMTVNKASRITAVTPSGHVYVDEDMAAVLRLGVGLRGHRTTTPDAARDRRRGPPRAAPRAGRASASPCETPTRDYDRPMTKVLLAEDDPAISDPLARALRREGYDVDVCTDGESALEEALRNPDLLVLDLGLPKMDGLEVCRRLRAEGSSVPVLVLTARADEVDTVVGLDAGADDYVTKPFRLAELLARARALLRRGVVEPPAARGPGARSTPRAAASSCAGRRCSSPARSSSCSRCSSPTRARSSRARSSCATSGTAPGTARPRRSTCTSRCCAGSSATTRRTRATSRPSVGSASASTPRRSDRPVRRVLVVTAVQAVVTTAAARRRSPWPPCSCGPATR